MCPARSLRLVSGNAKLARANRPAAAERALALRPVLIELAGLSARAAAAELNSRGDAH
jgi:hypothetical protein